MVIDCTGLTVDWERFENARIRKKQRPFGHKTLKKHPSWPQELYLCINANNKLFHQMSLLVLDLLSPSTCFGDPSTQRHKVPQGHSPSQLKGLSPLCSTDGHRLHSSSQVFKMLMNIIDIIYKLR